MVLPAVAGDRPCGDDVPLPDSRPLAKLDSERGEDEDLSDVIDRLDRVPAGQSSTAHASSGSSDSGVHGEAISGLSPTRPAYIRRPSSRAVPHTKHVRNLWCTKPTYLHDAISASSTVSACRACACTAAGTAVANHILAAHQRHRAVVLTLAP